MPATFTTLYCTKEMYEQDYAYKGLHLRDKWITAAPDAHVWVEA
jgi:hypothetical protein